MNDGASPRVVFDVEATLVLLSPLHVGSGGSRDDIPTVNGKDGANTKPAVAAIVRDADGNPYVPGTTIKGLLRRLAEARGMNAERLFGTIKLDTAGSPGRVTVFGARRIDGPAVPHGPFVAGAEAALGKGVFVAARTRIDPVSGTAGDHTLFHQEMVAPQTKFRLRLRIDARAEVDERGLKDPERADHALQTARAVRQDRDARAVAETDLADLLGLLNDLCAEDGQVIGKGQADGFGRVRLKPKTVTVTRGALDRSGTMTPKPRPDLAARILAAPGAADTGMQKKLTLTCPGPFCIVDSSKRLTAAERTAKRKPGEPEEHGAQLIAQRLAENAPLLLGSSVSGALRARARRLAAIDTKTSEENVDDPGKVIRKSAEATGLTATELLFGVTGWRGLLRIAHLEVMSTETWEVTSVRLDRFSGAPIDNALFKTATFLGTKIDLSLAFDERPLKQRQDETDERFATRLAVHGDGRTKAIERARKLFDRLVEDLRRPGRPLLLGHGVNKGFGWFDVKVLP